MIKVTDIKKRFGSIVAVDGISFSVAQGEVLGYLGPNGAGKSTTMRIINGFIRPDAGRVEVMNLDVARDPVKVRRLTGYVPENAQFYADMTVQAFLKFVCDARGIRGRERREAIGRVAERCAIDRVRHQLVETLSKGYKTRVALAQALIHDPPVLILDEPTEGLDPNQKHEVREMIRRMAAEKCIIISTHILEEVSAVCSRAIVIARGRILADGRPDELAGQAGGQLDAFFRRITGAETGAA